MTDTKQSPKFFDGFEPKTIRVDPIGPTAELRAKITALEALVETLRDALVESTNVRVQFAEDNMRLRSEVTALEAANQTMASYIRENLNLKAQVTRLTAALEMLRPCVLPGTIESALEKAALSSPVTETETEKI